MPERLPSRPFLALATLAAVLTTGPPPLPAAQDWGTSIDAAVDRFAPATIDIRHTLHQNPELSNREFETAKLVAAHLRALGIDVTTGVAHTGVVGVLEGGRPGPVIAVRADMDALPVTEDTPFQFKSTVRTEYLGQEVGVSHACGHDIHTAVQLGVASVLSSMREELPGTVKFIFQPAEEGPPPGERGGAELMFEQGVMNDPRPVAVFGLHSYAAMDVGTVGYTPGPALAAADKFVIDIKGKQVHAASPHLGIDPIVVGAEVVLALQTIRSRTHDPLEPGVVTVGIFRAGQRSNIIPDDVHLEGTVRTYSPEARDQAEQRMSEILDGITAAYGATYELAYERGYAATINDRELTAMMAPSIERVLGADNVMEIPPTMGAEDFSVFANDVPGFFFRLGQVKPGGTSGAHHTPDFQADDSSVPVGMRVMANVLVDFLLAAEHE